MISGWLPSGIAGIRNQMADPFRFSFVTSLLEMISGWLPSGISGIRNQIAYRFRLPFVTSLLEMISGWLPSGISRSRNQNATPGQYAVRTTCTMSVTLGWLTLYRKRNKA